MCVCVCVCVRVLWVFGCVYLALMLLCCVGAHFGSCCFRCFPTTRSNTIDGILFFLFLLDRDPTTVATEKELQYWNSEKATYERNCRVSQ